MSFCEGILFGVGLKGHQRESYHFEVSPKRGDTPFLHLLKILFFKYSPLLVLKGIRHYWTYFFNFSYGLNQMDALPGSFLPQHVSFAGDFSANKTASEVHDLQLRSPDLRRGGGPGESFRAAAAAASTCPSIASHPLWF